MCGIACIARIDGGVLDESADVTLKALADLLEHRGPDEREIMRSGPIGLAFTRLSLVDPEGGSQPLVSEDGDLVLIVNGEVYNHRELAAGLPAGTKLRSGSDCEVLLALYRRNGLRFLDQVRGMFGLILWDLRNNRLVLARDRLGIKPLFYHRDRRRVILASQITALFADRDTPRQLDWMRALGTPLLPAAPYFGDATQTTWFDGVESVPAATILQIDLATGETKRHQYWSFPSQPSDSAATPAEFINRYRDLLIESITECATADAELGLFLSGGIDSAAVAAIAARTAPGLNTFTVLSASTYRSEDAEYAHRLAGELGLPNHQVLFTPEHVPTPAEWKRLLWLTENPLCGPEIYYKHELHRYARMARPELRGMLLGAASDEFNGGYTVGIAEGGDWTDFVSNIRSMARTATLRARPDLMPWWTEARPLLTDAVVAAVTGTDVSDPYPAYLRWEYGKVQQYNVWHEDRTAAGSGIEARVPFLDHRLVELSASVPARLRQDLLWRKRILRAAMQGILPETFVQRPKGPFFYGSGVRHTYLAFLRMLLRDGAVLVEEALAAPGAADFIDGHAVRSRLTELVARPDHTDVEIVLRVLNLGLLAGMVTDLPPATAATPVGPPPDRLHITEWEQDRVRIELYTGARPTLLEEMVPTLAEGVLLLADPSSPNDHYLVVDGTIEYVLDAEATSVVRLLGALDGVTCLGTLLAEAGWSISNVPDELIELIDQGLVDLRADGHDSGRQ